MPNFQKQHPNDIITRCLVLQELRTVPPELILQLPKEYHKFVKGESSSLLDAKGKSTGSLQIDWEYALFEATNTRLIDLFEHFDKVEKTDEKTAQPISKR